MIDMMDMNQSRHSTGLTRAKHIERLTLWLGLPLLLALLCLAAGIVNYTPVQKYEAAKRPAPVQPARSEAAPRSNSMPLQRERVSSPIVPSEVGQAIDDLVVPNFS